MPRKEYHPGIVRDNNDPEKRGRVLVEAPSIVTGSVLDWAEPSFHFVDSEQQAGSFWVPNVGAVIEVEIEAEEDAEVNGLEFKWKCNVYPRETVPEVFKTNYPERRGWVTAAGHILYFDDTEDEQTLYYEHPSGSKFWIDNDGHIRLVPASGQSVYIGEESGSQPLVRGTALDTLVDGLINFQTGHVHSGGVLAGGLTGPYAPTPTGPVNPPSKPSDLLSDDHKVK